MYSYASENGLINRIWQDGGQTRPHLPLLILGRQTVRLPNTNLGTQEPGIWYSKTRCCLGQTKVSRRHEY